MPTGFENPFGLTVNLSFWQQFVNGTLPEQAKILFALGGWIIFSFLLIKKAAEFWAEYRQSTRGMVGWQWVVLAVDVPPLFIQTPKAVEQIFAHLSGAHAHIGLMEKFWYGKKQKWFSFEIISIEGYIQFLVRTEMEYRDLIEAAIYAQYPEAEITEVEDYVAAVPDHFPSADYDVMGLEFKMAQKDAYPIRTYTHFEYSLSKDAVFSDPMAALLENFSRIAHGENLWLQIMVEPSDSSWKEAGISIVKELMGVEDGHHGSGILSKVMSFPMALVQDVMTHGLQIGGGEGHDGHDEKPAKKDISPGTKVIIEGIEEKISKIGLKSKIRLLYAARKQVFNPARCVEGFVGAMNQFHVQSSNGVVPALSTHAHYDRKHTKSNHLKSSFVKAFKGRKMKWHDVGGYMLNIEELATIWHFPLPFVKTPLLHKSGYKRSEPPAGLPTEILESPLKRIEPNPGSHEVSVSVEPDIEELPYA